MPSNTILKAPEKSLVYPWAKGLKVDDILAYYDEAGFQDWTHAETGAPALKAQQPEFELWASRALGRRVRRLPHAYKREGALKISDHHVRSPLLNINRACQTCHKIPEDELKSRVETIQERTFRLRNLAMDALMDLITDLKQAKAAGKDDKQLDSARKAQRRASSCSISSKRKTPRAFTRHKKLRASWANRSMLRAKAKSACATTPTQARSRLGRSVIVTWPKNDCTGGEIWLYK